VTDWRIEPITADEIEELAKLHAISRRNAYRGVVADEYLRRVSDQERIAHWKVRLADDSRLKAAIGAHEAGRLVGFAVATHDTPGYATLNAMHVHPDRRAAGIGQLLHDEILHTMRAWACINAQLWVVAGNQRAQAFYRHNGWSEDGTRSTHTIGGGTVETVRYVRKL
jgi:GNAT superfamily N-acetyltransferase